MTEKIIIFENKGFFSGEHLGDVAKSAWPESVKTFNMEKLHSSDVEFFFTFCPLYASGALEESGLIVGPSSILESRVANKWNGINKVVEAEVAYLKNVGGDVHLKAVFANKGVLLNGTASEVDYEALAQHQEIYSVAFSQICDQFGVSGELTSYDQLGITFPVFVNPSDVVPVNVYKEEGKSDQHNLIEDINVFLSDCGLAGNILNNNNNRKKVKRIMNICGYEATFWIMAGYLAFDPMIPGLMGENSVYLVTERFDPLFGIASLTPELKEKPRIDIKA